MGIAGIAALFLGAALVLAFVILLLFEDGRRFLVKIYYLTKKMFGVEVGIRGFIQLVLYSALPALAVAFAQGARDSSQKGFDWQAFILYFVIVTAAGMGANIINRSVTLQKILSPGAGRVWRAQRKSVTAAIIQRLNRHITHQTATIDEVHVIIRDLLDVIVLHVRDHGGNFRNDRPRVFANLLLEDGTDLVVIARDRFSHSPEYQRPIPARYPKATMLCGRAMQTRKVLSVGVLSHAYPEGQQNKPYKSILAIPLFGAESDVPYGALSIDCSEPYFFESFAPGKVENDFENSLQPYAHLITLTMEALVSTERSIVISKLIQTPAPLPPKGGQP
ncbi:MAG: hypothetical protein CAF44_006285 [Nitrospira sp. CG24D]|jgi:hypothetical protein|nr:MAG: hypothetical protein CAF44_006285 [Nitrospira sp. CG24D]